MVFLNVFKQNLFFIFVSVEKNKYIQYQEFSSVIPIIINTDFFIPLSLIHIITTNSRPIRYRKNQSGKQSNQRQNTQQCTVTWLRHYFQYLANTNTCPRYNQSYGQ